MQRLAGSSTFCAKLRNAVASGPSQRVTLRSEKLTDAAANGTDFIAILVKSNESRKTI